MTQPPLADGLEGVVVAETLVSRVDGERGQLLVRGHDIRALASDHRFEDICSLLWTGELSTHGQAIGAELARGRQLAFAALNRLGDALDRTDGMDALRAAVAHLMFGGEVGKDSAGGSLPADVTTAAQLTGAVGTMVAAWWRHVGEQPAIEPDPERGHAADILAMLGRKASSPAEVRALDSYLATVIEHGMNASTFTARVVTSTGAGTVPAVVAAIGALAGPLHGGAPGPVLDMLDAIASAADDGDGRAAAGVWIEAELAAGRRIMGMGHRVYRVRDPRAAVLERAARKLVDERPASTLSARLTLAQTLEQVAEERLRARYPGRSLRANVEFYTAVLLDALDIDRRLFSPLFAASRTAGWMAHIFEQRARGRLIRPKARYVGPIAA